MRACRTMAHGLAVRTDRDDRMRVDTGFAQHGQRGRSECCADLDIEPSEIVQRNGRIPGCQREHALAQRIGIGRRMCRKNVQLRLEADQRRVDAVGAGA